VLTRNSPIGADDVVSQVTASGAAAAPSWLRTTHSRAQQHKPQRLSSLSSPSSSPNGTGDAAELSEVHGSPPPLRKGSGSSSECTSKKGGPLPVVGSLLKAALALKEPAIVTNYNYAKTWQADTWGSLDTSAKRLLLPPLMSAWMRRHNFSAASCAVVGNSGNLLLRRFGAAIDRHDLVRSVGVCVCANHFRYFPHGSHVTVSGLQPCPTAVCACVR
jgi:hypothetical protein